MDIIKFDDFAELGEYIIDLVDDNNCVSVVLFKNDIVNLLRWLMEYDDIDVGHIDIKDEFVDDYDKEYYLTIDDGFSISIEPVYDEDTNEIIPCYSDIVLFDGDVSSKIALENEDCEQIEISIAEDDEDNACGDCCYDCCNCPKIASQAITSALSMIDYIYNHLND